MMVWLLELTLNIVLNQIAQSYTVIDPLYDLGLSYYPSLISSIHEGLNVVENWNSANGFIFYGKGGEISTNRIEDQELSVLSLHLLENCLVYINTLMIQQVLSQKKWYDLMTFEDFRALTPLIYTHINPYGHFNLDMEERIPIEIFAS